jgi:hypothetical protein
MVLNNFSRYFFDPNGERQKPEFFLSRMLL